MIIMWQTLERSIKVKNFGNIGIIGLRTSSETLTIPLP